MFGIGGFELFLILLFGFLLVGPDKLPEIAKTVGKAIGKFRTAQEEMSKVVKPSDIFDPKSDEPFKDPIAALDKASEAIKEGVTDVAATASGVVKKKPASSSAASSAAKTESFTERKARYDRERAAKRAAEKEAAEAAAAKAADAPAPVETKIEDADAATGGASATDAKAAAAEAAVATGKGE